VDGRGGLTQSQPFGKEPEQLALLDRECGSHILDRLGQDLEAAQ
jgi:hypothetical protein